MHKSVYNFLTRHQLRCQFFEDEIILQSLSGRPATKDNYIHINPRTGLFYCDDCGGEGDINALEDSLNNMAHRDLAGERQAEIRAARQTLHLE